jgi:very-short-patch-repair endonuclease
LAKKNIPKEKKKTKSDLKEEYLLTLGKKLAVDLREKATPTEKIVYKWLKELKYNFQFQKPIVCNKKKLYILDFYLVDYQVFIELDGRQHYTQEGLKSDNLRSKRLKKQGLHPLRFPNSQIFNLTKEKFNEIILFKIQMLKEYNKFG